ncbi:hypothetical protein GLYMA_09G239950v4 [Glycine max]|nr:hypothetical protein GLYMA_09G239950v4 [Glycine max]KAH1044529.1 hypothetical protein GYH30_026011 [Glycine max]
MRLVLCLLLFCVHAVVVHVARPHVLDNNHKTG